MPEEDGDLLTELAHQALNGANLHNMVIIPGKKLMTRSDWMAEKVVVIRRKSRK